MGIYESQKKVLAGSNYSHFVIVGYIDCLVTRVGGCSFYIYLVLDELVELVV